MCLLKTAWVSLIMAGLDAPPVNQLLEGWENGCRAIRSYDLYVTVEVKTFLDPTMDWEPFKTPLFMKGSSHQILSEGKRRIEAGVGSPGEQPQIVSVWDQIAKSYDPLVRQLRIESKFNPTPDGIPQLNYESLYRQGSDGLEWIEVIKKRPNTIFERQEGSQFVIYTPPTEKGLAYSPFGLRVWLDSTKNFVPSRIEHLQNISGKEIVRGEIQNTLAEVAPAVWAVTESAFSGFPPILQTGSPPRKTNVATVKVDMRVSKFNCEIPESLFKIEVPVGTTVYDGILGTRYVIGKAKDRASHLSELVVQGKVSAEKLREFVEKNDSPETMGSRWQMLLYLNVAGLILLAFVLSYRRYRRKRTNKPALPSP